MKKLLLPLAVLCCSFLPPGNKYAPKPEIKWKKMETRELVRATIDKYIHTGDELYYDYKFLEKEKHEFMELKGDSVIRFNSPFVAVNTFSMLSHKWMFTFHYRESRLDHYDLEEGLPGP